MTLSIDDLARESEFSLELTSLGTIRFRSLNAQDISNANKKLSYIGAQGLPFVRWLFAELAMNSVDASTDSLNSIEDKSLSPEELALVTDNELEDFAGKLLQKNRYLLKSDKAARIEMSVDESGFDFLVRAFRHYASEQRSRWEKITKPAFPDYPFTDMKHHLEGASRVAAQLLSVQNLIRAHASPFHDEIRYILEASLSFKLANTLYQNESLLREATRALNRTESISAIFESELERQLLGARESLQNYESMFRLPCAGEAIHLFDSHEIGKVLSMRDDI